MGLHPPNDPRGPQHTRRGRMIPADRTAAPLPSRRRNPLPLRPSGTSRRFAPPCHHAVRRRLPLRRGKAPTTSSAALPDKPVAWQRPNRDGDCIQKISLASLAPATTQPGGRCWQPAIAEKRTPPPADTVFEIRYFSCHDCFAHAPSISARAARRSRVPTPPRSSDKAAQAVADWHAMAPIAASKTPHRAHSFGALDAKSGPTTMLRCDHLRDRSQPR